MKTLNKIKKETIFLVSFLCLTLSSCNDSYLEEKPKDFLSPDNTYVDKAGFDAALAGLYANARGIQAAYEGLHEKEWEVLMGQGADIGFHIDYTNFITDYRIVNSFNSSAANYWTKCFSILKDANVIISRVQKEGVNLTEEEKTQITAEARFFRAFSYRILVWFFGGVPIIEEELTAPKLDFVRASEADVLNFIIADLEFCSANLPQTNATGYRATKAAADYLLAETYNATKQWDKAISAADRIINDSQYALMTERFGTYADKPGDPYWDLFRMGNQNRGAGNKETIFAWNFEFNVNGGARIGTERAWGPFLERLITPDGKQAILKDEFLGRPVVFIRITEWVEKGMWDDFDNDMRNSEYNVQRVFYVNNPASSYFGKEIEPNADNYVRNMFPYYKKFTTAYGHVQGYDSGGNIYNDWYLFRLAGVYLLRAEAHLGKGNPGLAAADINVIRDRAHAKNVSAGDMNIDFILDERARELLGEEYRRITLSRTRKLVERTKLHNPISGPTIQDFNRLLPIPQREIDANKGAVLEQNEGY